MPRLRLVLAGAGLVFVAALVHSGLTASNRPVNAPLTGRNAPITAAAAPQDGGELWVGLGFSGGGTRATAFATGMVQEIRAMTATPERPLGILTDLRLVTGVSGGSVAAAWIGLHGVAGIDGFRDAWLVKDGERYMSMSPWNPFALARVLGGGAIDDDSFRRVLDEELFHGATFADVAKSPIITWINATDIANNVTFPFLPETFDALCSDLSQLPVSEAVTASAAYPLVFAPVVLTARGGTCGYRQPDWLTTARYNPEATSTMRAYAKALESYADPARVRYLKLYDGGITDNFGTTALAVERARARAAYAPLTPAEAVRMKRLLFLVSDAGLEWHYGWTQRLRGPGGATLGVLIARSAMRAATRSGYDALRLELADWHRDLVDYRCRLSLAEVLAWRGSLDGWDCRDVKLFVGEIGFEDVDADTKARLDRVPTRLRLTPAEVDLVLAAAREATRNNPELRGFLRSLAPAAGPQASGDTPPRRIEPQRGR
jgi:NTE family protein